MIKWDIQLICIFQHRKQISLIISSLYHALHHKNNLQTTTIIMIQICSHIYPLQKIIKNPHNPHPSKPPTMNVLLSQPSLSPSNKPPNLPSLLSTPNLTPQQLFSHQNIIDELKQNIQLFFKFLAKKHQFTTHLFRTCLESEYESLDKISVKKVVQFGMDVLTYDQQGLHKLLFTKGDKGKKAKNGEQDKIQDIVSPSIQTQAQKLFADVQPNKQEAEWQKQQDAFGQFQLLALSLTHLKSPHINQTCLGYINRLYASSLRRQGNLFLEFLSKNQSYCQALINNIQYYSIGSMLALVLSCEDKSGEYKYEGMKADLFRKMMEYGFTNIGDNDKFYGFMLVVQQLLTLTKQNYYQYFDDFKRCANILVTSQNLHKFYKHLDSDEISFKNSSSYLQMIIKRINCQIQQLQQNKDNNIQHHQSCQSTMKFQHGFLLFEFQHLVQLLQKSIKYLSLARINFLGFFHSLLKYIKGKQTNLKNVQAIKKIVGVYCQQLSSGIIKNYLYQILSLLIKQLNDQQLKQLTHWFLTVPSQQYPPLFLSQPTLNIKNIQIDICFILQLLFQIGTRSNNFLNQYDQKYQVNLLEVQNKFKTQLAGFGKQNQGVNGEQDTIDLVLNFNSKNDTRNDGKSVQHRQTKNSPQPQILIKNHIEIPMLNLPTKTLPKVTIQQQHVQQVKVNINENRENRDKIIKQLKNTKIQIPSKLKIKKLLLENYKKNMHHTTSLQQIKQQKKVQQHWKSVSSSHQQISNKYQQLPTNMCRIQIHQQKYFIRHFLLF